MNKLACTALRTAAALCVALILAVGANVSQPSRAEAQGVVLPGFPPGVFQDHSVYDPPPVAAPAKSYAFVESYNYSISGTSNNETVNMGASASYGVIVATTCQNGTAATATVAGVSLSMQTPSVFADANGIAIFSGTVSSGGSGSQTVNTTWTGSAFGACGAVVWTTQNLSSMTAQANGTGNGNGGAPPIATLANTAGYFMFCYINSGVPGMTFSGGTETPARQDNQNNGSFYFQDADWTTAVTSGSWAGEGSTNGNSAITCSNFT
jgi:hypothetical protein